MDSDRIGQMFNDKYKGRKNFITPEVLRYGSTKQHIYEVSKGTALGGGYMYGVTVLRKDGKQPAFPNQSFHDLPNALMFAEELP